MLPVLNSVYIVQVGSWNQRIKELWKGLMRLKVKSFILKLQ